MIHEEGSWWKLVKETGGGEKEKERGRREREGKECTVRLLKFLV